jgi:putative acetyltransferase
MTRTSDITIRKYREDDLAGLMAVWESASALAHPFLPADFVAQVRHDIPNVYLPNAETWVAEQHGQIIGFLSLLGSEVGAIFVHPDHHRRGIGSDFIDMARELKGELTVEVFAANTIGREFYARRGFTTLATTLHEPTGCELIRLQLSTGLNGQEDDSE